MTNTCSSSTDVGRDISLSIIVVTFNSREITLNCLASLAQYPPSAEHEVIVVDNASEDGTAEAIRKTFPGIELLVNSKNLGFSAANNIGIAYSRGSYILLLNSDTLVSRGALDLMVHYIEQHPAVGALGCQLLYEDGSLQLSYNTVASLFSVLLQSFGIRNLVPRHFFRLLRTIPPRFILTKTLRNYLRWFTESQQETTSPRKLSSDEYISGACMMVRRAVFVQVGLLDEGFFMYCEDADYCMRVAKAGWEIHFLPSAQIIHLLGKSSGPDFRETSLEARRSVLYFFAKHRSRTALWLASGLLCLGVARSVLFGTFRKNTALPFRKGCEMMGHLWRSTKSFACGSHVG